nr:MAG TPA: hypothetical protein [Caudoviricetes sp.]
MTTCLKTSIPTSGFYFCCICTFILKTNTKLILNCTKIT